MAFMIIPEIKEMINKLQLYIKSARTSVQQRYYENALRDLQQLLQTMETEQCKTN